MGTEIHTWELVFPEHANPSGAAFGGYVLGLMDKVGSYAAVRRAQNPVVTVAVGEVTFKVPIRTGDLLEVIARVVRTGRTSIECEIEVWREGFGRPGARQLATTGRFTYVSVDDHGKPRPIPAETADRTTSGDGDD